MFDEYCETPMDYVGIEDKGHALKCSAEFGQRPRAVICPKYRYVPIDNGCFQRIVYGSELVSKAIDIRKHGERPFNLLKKRDVLEPVRVRSQHGLVTKVTFTTIVTLPQRCINLWHKNATLALYKAIKKRYAVFRTSPYV